MCLQDTCEYVEALALEVVRSKKRLELFRKVSLSSSHSSVADTLAGHSPIFYLLPGFGSYHTTTLSSPHAVRALKKMLMLKMCCNMTKPINFRCIWQGLCMEPYAMPVAQQRLRQAMGASRWMTLQRISA